MSAALGMTVKRTDSILVLGCASVTPHGRDQMRRLSTQARRRGLRLLGADTEWNLGNAPTLLDDRLVDAVIPLDAHDPKACRSWAAGTPEELSAVLTFREMCVEPLADIGEELGLACNSPATVRTLRNKDRCREALRAAGFPQPPALLARDVEDARRFIETHPGPWIVKPPAGMGSAGVTKVEQPGGLQPAVDRLEPGAPFLIEGFVHGEEYSTEGVMLGGSPVILALTKKRTSGGFIETGHRIPAPLDGAQADTATQEVTRALRALGVTRGIFHVEFWVADGRVVLGEVHVRPGGDFLHAMVEFTRPGLELYGLLIDDLLGRPVSDPPSPKGAAGAEFLMLPPGTVRSVRGWADVVTDSAVLAADLAVGPGDRIEPVRDSSGRQGVVVVGADSFEAVETALERLLATVCIDVE